MVESMGEGETIREEIEWKEGNERERKIVGVGEKKGGQGEVKMGWR